jgi:hypothetical protein
MKGGWSVFKKEPIKTKKNRINSSKYNALKELNIQMANINTLKKYRNFIDEHNLNKEWLNSVTYNNNDDPIYNGSVVFTPLLKNKRNAIANRLNNINSRKKNLQKHMGKATRKLSINNKAKSYNPFIYKKVVNW